MMGWFWSGVGGLLMLVVLLWLRLGLGCMGNNCVIFCMFMNLVYNVVVIGVRRKESVSFVSLSYVFP